MYSDYSGRPDCYVPVTGAEFNLLAVRYSDLCRTSMGMRAEASSLLHRYRAWMPPEDAYRCLWHFCDLHLQGVVMLLAKRGRTLNRSLLSQAVTGEHDVPEQVTAEYCREFMSYFYSDHHGDLPWGTEPEEYNDSPIHIISVHAVIPATIYLFETSEPAGVPFADTRFFVSERDGRLRFLDLFDYYGYVQHSDPNRFPYLD